LVSFAGALLDKGHYQLNHMDDNCLSAILHCLSDAGAFIWLDSRGASLSPSGDGRSMLGLLKKFTFETEFSELLVNNISRTVSANSAYLTTLIDVPDFVQELPQPNRPLRRQISPVMYAVLCCNLPLLRAMYNIGASVDGVESDDAGTWAGLPLLDVLVATAQAVRWSDNAPSETGRKREFHLMLEWLCAEGHFLLFKPYPGVTDLVLPVPRWDGKSPPLTWDHNARPVCGIDLLLSTETSVARYLFHSCISRMHTLLVSIDDLVIFIACAARRGAADVMVSACELLATSYGDDSDDKLQNALRLLACNAAFSAEFDVMNTFLKFVSKRPPTPFTLYSDQLACTLCLQVPLNDSWTDVVEHVVFEAPSFHLNYNFLNFMVQYMCGRVKYASGNECRRIWGALHRFAKARMLVPHFSEDKTVSPIAVRPSSVCFT
jgi:hypothetical protein